MSKIKYKKLTMSLLFASLLWLSGCTAENEVQNLYGVELEAPEQSNASSGQGVSEQSDATPGQGALVNYTTTQAEYSEFTRRALANVSLSYPVKAELVCEKENATVREVLTNGKEPVKKGDVLISFDVEVNEVEIEKNSLKLQRCLEAMDEGKAEREEAILAAQTTAETLQGLELELALLKIEKLQAEYDEFIYVSEHEAAQYRDALAWLEQEKAGYDLTAPFDGLIEHMEIVKSGDRVEKGQVLITMYSPEHYYLAAEDIAGNLRYNQEVTITAGPKDDTKTYTGKVVSAYNVLLPAVPKGDPLIRLEEEVEAGALEIAPVYEADIEKLQNILLIDKNTVRMDKDKSYVRILEDDMIQKRYVLPGLRNTDKVWIIDGLSEEQKVIAE